MTARTVLSLLAGRAVMAAGVAIADGARTLRCLVVPTVVDGLVGSQVFVVNYAGPPHLAGFGCAATVAPWLPR